MRYIKTYSCWLVFCLGFLACHETKISVSDFPKEKLSEYGFFKGDLSKLIVSDELLKYELNNSLFSDYAHKQRLVWMPENTNAKARTDGTLHFPESSMLVKTFYYPANFQKPNQDRNIIETRLLHFLDDEWQVASYIWNKTQTEAHLHNTGDIRRLSWIDELGKEQNANYQIPNKNQCKSCHNHKDNIVPIGPTLGNLNRTISYQDIEANQLAIWFANGFLNEPYTEAKHTPYIQWTDSTASLNGRAMAYLDMNCGFCHNENAPASTSGLHLTIDADLDKIGICKSPVAAGKGSGGRLVDIDPGNPENSILLFRMESTDPGILMPEIGRSVVHKEGVKLIRSWIAEMEGSCD